MGKTKRGKQNAHQPRFNSNPANESGPLVDDIASSEEFGDIESSEEIEDTELLLGEDDRDEDIAGSPNLSGENDYPGDRQDITFPPEIVEAVRALVQNEIKAQVDGLEMRFAKTLNAHLATEFDKLSQRVGRLVQAASDDLAKQAEAKLAKRMDAAGVGDGNQGMNNPILQAILAKAMGGGGNSQDDFLTQASKVGDAIQKMTQPWAQVQNAMFGNALRLIDLSQKLGSLSPEEKEKQLRSLESAGGL